MIVSEKRIILVALLLPYKKLKVEQVFSEWNQRKVEISTKGESDFPNVDSRQATLK